MENPCEIRLFEAHSLSVGINLVCENVCNRPRCVMTDARVASTELWGLLDDKPANLFPLEVEQDWGEILFIWGELCASIVYQFPCERNLRGQGTWPPEAATAERFHQRQPTDSCVFVRRTRHLKSKNWGSSWVRRLQEKKTR